MRAAPEGSKLLHFDSKCMGFLRIECRTHVLHSLADAADSLRQVPQGLAAASRWSSSTLRASARIAGTVRRVHRRSSCRSAFEAFRQLTLDVSDHDAMEPLNLPIFVFGELLVSHAICTWRSRTAPRLSRKRFTLRSVAWASNEARSREGDALRLGHHGHRPHPSPRRVYARRTERPSGEPPRGAWPRR